MPGPWLLLALALTLTLTGVPGGRSQPEATQQEAATAVERPGLDDLLRQAGRLLLLREDLQRLRADQGQHDTEPQSLQPDWLYKRQHPGKREEEEAEEGAEEEEEEEGGAGGPHKRQHPGRREDESSWSFDVTQHKRQHPGRRSPWLGYAVTKRQHPGRWTLDPKAQRSWEEEEEDVDGEVMPEKRQHPGKRTPGGPCGPQVACGQAGFLLGLLDDLSQSHGAEEKRQHPGRRAAWAREPLEE
ncbi:thyrotropin releasing hormone [Choloepus didactylus]|uniref:thyrotropin releasing hormone n=1 Tax=Choloepus didactylus TaxID=27675 RepID=UPI00189CF902|nr:thyrotropin releasing hormone [Choloepus didactylus]XP_037685527.1 thyrotropin releasing hormone [Choloepus didactylus]